MTLEPYGMLEWIPAVILDHMALAAMITDREGRILYVNPRFTQVTGYPLGEIIGQNPRVLKSGLTPVSVHQDLWTTVLAGRVWHGQLSNRKKNGQVYLETIHITPVKNREGEITHFVAVWDDVSWPH